MIKVPKLDISRKTSFLLATFGLALVIACGTLFFLRFNQHFPLIQSGAYIGELSGLEFEQSQSKLRFYLEKPKDAKPLLVAFLTEEAEVQLVEEHFGQPGQKRSKPLTLRTKEGSIHLVGAKVSDSHYSGTFSLNGQQGRWSMRALKEAPVYDLNSPDFLNRARIADRMNSVFESINEQERAIILATQRKSEIESLISDKDALRQRSAAHYQQELENMASLELHYNSLRQQVAELKSQVELARNVTSKGRLVSLARESLDRENRWLETMLKSEPSAEYLRQQEATLRAREILEINRNIAYERQRIIELRSRLYDYP
jgi:hypothetical protein